VHAGWPGRTAAVLCCIAVASLAHALSACPQVGRASSLVRLGSRAARKGRGLREARAAAIPPRALSAASTDKSLRSGAARTPRGGGRQQRLAKIKDRRSAVGAALLLEVDPDLLEKVDVEQETEMTVGLELAVVDGTFQVCGKSVLSSVPSNIVLTPDLGPTGVRGAFLGATAEAADSLHVFSLGRFSETRFLCCFRFKLWWMTQRVGTRAAELPNETQFLLLEIKDEAVTDASGRCHESILYVVLLPLLDGSFRASFSGSAENDLLLTCQSGDKEVLTSECRQSVYVNWGSNPFDTISEAVRSVEDHSKSFLRREHKKVKRHNVLLI